MTRRELMTRLLEMAATVAGVSVLVKEQPFATGGLVTSDEPMRLHSGESIVSRPGTYRIEGPVGDAAFAEIIQKQLAHGFGPMGYVK